MCVCGTFIHVHGVARSYGCSASLCVRCEFVSVVALRLQFHRWAGGRNDGRSQGRDDGSFAHDTWRPQLAAEIDELIMPLAQIFWSGYPPNRENRSILKNIFGRLTPIGNNL